MDADARDVHGNGEVLAGQLGVPDAGVEHVDFTRDEDLAQVVDHDYRGIAVAGDVPSSNLDLQWLVRPVAKAAHDLARLLSVLLDVRAVSRNAVQLFDW